MGKASPRKVVVLDAGALIAFEKGDPRMRALLREIAATKGRLLLPAPVLAQVWRRPAEQVALRALASSVFAEIVPLDGLLAEAVGVLCGRTKTRDVVDAAVVLIARRASAVVVTSDRGDLSALDPHLDLVSI